jgi:hypothetical protein
MAMNRDLFLAILSMDSYNRGYVQGIKGLDSPGPNPDDDLKIRIGKAKIIRDANDASGLGITVTVHQNIAFHGIAPREPKKVIHR